METPNSVFGLKLKTLEGSRGGLQKYRNKPSKNFIQKRQLWEQKKQQGTKNSSYLLLSGKKRGKKTSISSFTNYSPPGLSEERGEYATNHPKKCNAKKCKKCKKKGKKLQLAKTQVALHVNSFL